MNNASVMSINAMTMQEAHDCILNDVTKLSQRTKEQLGMLPTDQARSHVAAATTPAASEELPAEVLTDLHCIQAAVDQSTQQAAQQIHARGRDDQLAVLIRGALASTTGHGTVCLNAALNLLSAS